MLQKARQKFGADSLIKVAEKVEIIKQLLATTKNDSEARAQAQELNQILVPEDQSQNFWNCLKDSEKELFLIEFDESILHLISKDFQEKVSRARSLIGKYPLEEINE